MSQHADPSMTFNDRYYGRDVRDTAERMESANCLGLRLSTIAKGSRTRGAWLRLAPAPPTLAGERAAPRCSN
jgi:hypothetical protein